MKDSVSFGELGTILANNAKSFRNGKLANEILPQLVGQPINERTVRQMLEPYIAQLDSQLPPETQRMVQTRFEQYVPKAMRRVQENLHMHQADTLGLMSQANADAILICFANEACAPLDLALYARDLLPLDAQLA